ncbi:hypothetical protein POTOM_048798 [Populus tomentosa]|uniref:Uncharacterized protein n=1 Tax=Populus tomentosa TaxID=118781 RepID=A0A8X7YDK2_POPTO|nr:hypothetical protein POTOM_048798 [Populus tomentosa]
MRSLFMPPISSPKLTSLFPFNRKQTESVHRVFPVTLTGGWVSHSDDGAPVDELVVPLFSADKLDGGLNSLPPPFFVMDLLFVWPDGVSGSFSVHLQPTPTTIADVDFSADTVGARFFEGFDVWVDAINTSGHGGVSPTYLCNAGCHRIASFATLLLVYDVLLIDAAGFAIAEALVSDLGADLSCWVEVACLVLTCFLCEMLADAWDDISCGFCYYGLGLAYLGEALSPNACTLYLCLLVGSLDATGLLQRISLPVAGHCLGFVQRTSHVVVQGWSASDDICSAFVDTRFVDAVGCPSSQLLLSFS